MAGIYLHIPFCKQKCSYCDFHFSTNFQSYRERMVKDIVRELRERQSYLEGRHVKTIYFGGGTPSLLNADELKLLLDAIRNNFELDADLEISLEANPDDITTSNLDLWKEAGINRLSIGLQSFKASDLEWMNRAHSTDEALQCVSLAQQHGFDNLTVDLMYGLPDLTEQEWRSHIRQVLDFGVPHVSAYCLTVEEKTALDNWVRKGKITPAGEDQQSEQFQLLIEELENAGLEQYEISNFAKSGFESKHNSNYWKGEWYLGVGPSAHSFNGTSRRWNVANNHQYMKGLETNEAYGDDEVLSPKDQFNEYLMTGLRTVYGVELNRLKEILPLGTEFERKVDVFKKQEWMQESDGVLRLSKQGRLKADYIASELFVLDNEFH